MPTINFLSKRNAKHPHETERDGENHEPHVIGRELAFRSRTLCRRRLFVFHLTVQLAALCEPQFCYTHFFARCPFLFLSPRMDQLARQTATTAGKSKKLAAAAETRAFSAAFAFQRNTDTFRSGATSFAAGSSGEKTRVHYKH